MKKNKLSCSKIEPGRILGIVASAFYKVIPKVLVIAFIITSLNLNGINRILAKEMSINESEYSQVDYSEVNNTSEVVELRTNNSKVFRKQNGAYELEVFSQEVHYEEDGKFYEIDNTLKDEDDHFINSRNKFKVNISKDLAKYSKVKIKNHSLEWKFNNITSAKIKEKQSNKVEYQNVFNQSTNLEYIILDDRIKENVILTEYINNFEFSYTLRTDLKIERNDNVLYLYDDSDNVIYTINEYFMYDKNNVVSYDIDFTISNINDNEYLINVYPDDNYLKNASYPVIIDPEIGISVENIIGSIDTKYFDSSSNYFPDPIPQSPTNYPIIKNNAKLLMNICFPSSVGGFNLDTLKYSNLLYAYVSMPTQGIASSYPRSYSSTPTSKVVASSIDTPLNWNNISGIYTYSKTYLSEQEFSSGSVFTHRFDILDHLRNNSNKFGTNFNIMLEFTLSGGPGSYVKYNHSYLNGDYTIPSVKIGYSNDAGLKDYFTYEEIPSSYNCVSYVAHNSGNLTSVYNDYSTGNLLNIAHIYNSNRSNVLTDFGKGYRLNYQENVTTSGLLIYLTKGDGSEVTFVKESTSNNIYIAQDGSGDKITKYSSSYELITKDDAKKFCSFQDKC